MQHVISGDQLLSRHAMTPSFPLRGGQTPCPPDGNIGSWSNYFEVVVQASQVTGLVYNVWFDLSRAPAGFWSKVQPDGRDIRVRLSDGVTDVPRDIAGIHVGPLLDVGGIYFKAVGLSTTVNTTYRIYYGNPVACEPLPGSSIGYRGVWDDGWLLASHDAGLTDRTPNQNHADSILGGVGFSNVRGLSGNFALDFNGVDQAIVTPIPSIDSPFSIECWASPDLAQVDGHMISNFNFSLTDDVYLRHTTNDVLHLNVDTPGGIQSNPNAITIGNFQWLGGFLNNASVLVRRNGANLVIGGVSNGNRTHDNGANFAIGGRAAAGGKFDGKIEHVELREKDTSHAIRDTRGRNFTVAGFWTVGAEQAA